MAKYRLSLFLFEGAANSEDEYVTFEATSMAEARETARRTVRADYAEADRDAVVEGSIAPLDERGEAIASKAEPITIAINA